MRISLAALPLLLGACQLSLDRWMPHGEIRVVVEGEESGTGTRMGLSDVRARLEGTSLLARSDPRGRIVVRNVPSGSHTLWLSRDADGDGRPESQLRLTSIVLEPIAGGGSDRRNSRDIGKILLEPAGSLEGTLTRDGSPVEGVVVAIKGQPNIFARSTRDGTFSFPFLAPGIYALVTIEDESELLVSGELGEVEVRPRQQTRVERTVPPPASVTAGLHGRFVFDDRIGPATKYDELTPVLVGSDDQQHPIQPGVDGTWNVTLPVGFYTLRVTGELGLQPFELGGLAAYPEAEAPTIYLFPLTPTGDADTDGDGEPDEQDADDDNDGIPDAEDGHAACARDPDGNRDSDGDGTCDTVDLDADGDSIVNPFDNCPFVANANQTDLDGDGIGDACDNCPAVANPEQSGTDPEDGTCRSACVDNPNVCGPGTCRHLGPGSWECACPRGTSFDGATCSPAKLVLSGAARMWSDGTFARSCAAYRQPGQPYMYDGDTGSGIYRIAPHPDDVTFEVWCDMEGSDGWTLAAKIQAGASSAWTYDSPLWTTAGALLSADDLTLAPGEAKYPAFDQLAFTRLRFVDPENGRTWELEQTGSSLQALFANTPTPGIDEEAFTGTGAVPEDPAEVTSRGLRFDPGSLTTISSFDYNQICSDYTVTAESPFGINAAGVYKTSGGTARGRVRLGIWYAGSDSHIWSRTADCGQGVGVSTSGVGGAVESATTMGAFTTVWILGPP